MSTRSWGRQHEHDDMRPASGTRVTPLGDSTQLRNAITAVPVAGWPCDLNPGTCDGCRFCTAPTTPQEEQ